MFGDFGEGIVIVGGYAGGNPGAKLFGWITHIPSPRCSRPVQGNCAGDTLQQRESY